MLSRARLTNGPATVSASGTASTGAHVGSQCAAAVTPHAAKPAAHRASHCHMPGSADAGALSCVMG
jgi:hypothetical protein